MGGTENTAIVGFAPDDGYQYVGDECWVAGWGKTPFTSSFAEKIFARLRNLHWYISTTKLLFYYLHLRMWTFPKFEKLPFVVYYRPQTKFAKVMFLHLSVILFTGGVPGQVHPSGRYTPRQVNPPAGTPGQVPQGRYTPEHCITGYGQQASRTHPTGMNSCIDWCLWFSNILSNASTDNFDSGSVVLKLQITVFGILKFHFNVKAIFVPGIHFY